MQAPPAGIIEAARDQLVDVDYLTTNKDILMSQEKEVRFACPNKSEDFFDGYRLGMMVARLMLQTTPLAPPVDL